MKRKTITKKQIGIAFACLLILCISAAILNNLGKESVSDGYTLTISREGQEVKTFTFDEIKNMEALTVEKEIVSSSHEDEKGFYTGVPLAAILDAADPSLLRECGNFITLAGDSFSSALSAAEVQESENVLVVYQKDGENLLPFTEGGSGPLRVIILSDEYGNRCTKYLVGVECR